MSIHPLTWFNPSRIGGDAELLLNRTVTLARLLVYRLVDDVEGDAATQVVSLSYRGVGYELDLTEKDATGLDQVLAPYLSDARRVTAKRGATHPRASASRHSADPKEVRAWAKTQGIAVADRGRVSAHVIRLYRDAHRG